MKTGILAGVTALALAIGTTGGFAQVNLNTGASGKANTSGNVGGTKVETDTNVKSSSGVTKDRSGLGVNTDNNASGKIKVNPNR